MHFEAETRLVYLCKFSHHDYSVGGWASQIVGGDGKNGGLTPPLKLWLSSSSGRALALKDRGWKFKPPLSHFV